MNIAEKNFYYYILRATVVDFDSGVWFNEFDQRIMLSNTYNELLRFFLYSKKKNVFMCDNINDINNFVKDGPNNIIINFQIDETNCDIFYDFLGSLRETKNILIINCSSEIVIENICEIAKFIPNLMVIHSSDHGYMYRCTDIEEKMLNIRYKKCKSANK